MSAEILEVKAEHKHIPLLLRNLPFHYVWAQSSGCWDSQEDIKCSPLSQRCNYTPSAPPLPYKHIITFILLSFNYPGYPGAPRLPLFTDSCHISGSLLRKTAGSCRRVFLHIHSLRMCWNKNILSGCRKRPVEGEMTSDYGFMTAEHDWKWWLLSPWKLQKCIFVKTDMIMWFIHSFCIIKNLYYLYIAFLLYFYSFAVFILQFSS